VTAAAVVPVVVVAFEPVEPDEPDEVVVAPDDFGDDEPPHAVSTAATSPAMTT
jgi:hypothetical protein